jgi:hypothetical protein
MPLFSGFSRPTQLSTYQPSQTASQQPPLSASVLHFTCLYTRDIVRKHKRWQDGTLNFHTFNSRIMVYDSTSHQVGDAHWRMTGGANGEEFPGEGGEVRLQNGVLVEIGERTRVGETVTDLRPLLERKEKAKQPSWTAGTEPGGEASEMRSSGGLSTGVRSTGLMRRVGIGNTQSQVQSQRPKHRSLSSILKGGSQVEKAPVTGRAFAFENPYEKRRKQLMSDEIEEDERPIKRRKAPSQETFKSRSKMGQKTLESPKSNQGIRPLSEIVANGSMNTSDVVDLTDLPSQEDHWREPAPSRPLSKSTTSQSSHQVPDVSRSKPLDENQVSTSPKAISSPPKSRVQIPPTTTRTLKLPKFKSKPRSKLVCMEVSAHLPKPKASGLAAEPKQSLEIDDIEVDNDRTAMPPPRAKNSKTPAPRKPVLSGYSAATSSSRGRPPRTITLVVTPLSSSHPDCDIDPTPIPLSSKPVSSPGRPSSTFEPVIHTITAAKANGLDIGPWSIEAGDLFDWRPPNWEEMRGGMNSTVEAID